MKEPKKISIEEVHKAVELSLIKNKVNFIELKSRFSEGPKESLLLILKTLRNSNTLYIVIQFWESKKELIAKLKVQNIVGDMTFLKEFRGKRQPGILFIEADINEPMIYNILKLHYNFEQAKQPSIHARIQFVTANDNLFQVIDSTDDRFLRVMQD